MPQTSTDWQLRPAIEPVSRICSLPITKETTEFFPSWPWASRQQMNQGFLPMNILVGNKYLKTRSWHIDGPATEKVGGEVVSFLEMYPGTYYDKDDTPIWVWPGVFTGGGQYDCHTAIMIITLFACFLVKSHQEPWKIGRQDLLGHGAIFKGERWDDKRQEPWLNCRWTGSKRAQDIGGCSKPYWNVARRKEVHINDEDIICRGPKCTERATSASACWRHGNE